MIPHLEVMPARPQAPLGGAPYHRWELDGGEVWAEFHRRDDEVIIRFPELADFCLPSPQGDPVCWPAPGLTDETREHLFVNQVLPLLQGRSGRLALHASAVVVGGAAIAFVGPSRRGKSTLATAFASDGCPLLSDDGLILSERDGIHTAHAGHPSIRLWDDSRKALLPPKTARAAPVSYTDKARLLAGAELPFASAPVPLRVAYFLGDAEVGQTRIGLLSGGALVAECIQHSFMLEPDDPAALAAHFSMVAAFTAAVPCYRLDYPRCYDSLPAVRRAIVTHANPEDPR